MNLLQDNVRKLYFKYFGAAFGSAMVSSIYGHLTVISNIINYFI